MGETYNGTVLESKYQIVELHFPILYSWGNCHQVFEYWEYWANNKLIHSESRCCLKSEYSFKEIFMGCFCDLRLCTISFHQVFNYK